MKRLFILVFALSFLSACGGMFGAKKTNNGPDWLDGTSAKYPNSLYIVGSGQSLSLADAKNKARAEVAKVFEVAIHAQSISNMQYVQDSNGETMTQKVDSNVTTETQKVLSGIEIADTWFDKQSHQHYALAILNRDHSAQAFRQQIDTLDSNTQIHLDKAKQSNDTLDKVANLYAALSEQMERASLQRSLQVVDHSGRGEPPQWELAQLSTQLRTQMGKIRITTRVTGPEGFADQVNGALGRTGFLVKQGDIPDFTLSASLHMGKPIIRDGWYWVNARLEILLSDAQAHIRGSKRWEIKQSATDEELAKKRAMDQAASILQDNLRSTLMDFAQ